MQSLSLGNPYLSPRPGSAHSNLNRRSLPSSKQEAAIKDLKEFDAFTISTWLTLLRSIDPSIQLRAGPTVPGCVTSQQLDALSTLKECHNDDVSTWLESTLLGGNGNTQRASNTGKRPATRRSAATSPRQTRQNSAKSSHRSSTCSIGPCSTRSNPTSKSTPRSSLGNGSVLFDLPEGLPEDGECGHSHYCTHSEHPKAIGTCDAWKRHEREHEVVYRCMPFGAIENTGAGPECAFCGSPNPSQGHLQEHHALTCPGASRKPLTLSRRSNLVKHLTLHNIFGEEASALAGKWRYVSNKRAFSCGFCIEVFATLADRSSHIDNEHWKAGRDMSTWSLSYVIKGLLLQPAIREVWQGLMASNVSLSDSSFRWDLPHAEGLQLKLELGEDSATELVDLAYSLSNYGSEYLYQKNGMAICVPAIQQMEVDAYSLDCLSSTATLRMPLVNSRQAATKQRKDLALRTQPFPAWSNSNISSSDSLGWQARQSFPSDIFGDEVDPFFDGNSYMVQPPSSFDMPLNSPPAMSSDSQLNCLSSNRGYSTSSAVSLTTQLLRPAQEQVNNLSPPTAYHQHCGPWSNKPERADHGTALASQAAQSSRIVSPTSSTSSHLLQKPLPPIPDQQTPHPNETGASSFMELDSD